MTQRPAPDADGSSRGRLAAAVAFLSHPDAILAVMLAVTFIVLAFAFSIESTL